MNVLKFRVEGSGLLQKRSFLIICRVFVLAVGPVHCTPSYLPRFRHWLRTHVLRGLGLRV